MLPCKFPRFVSYSAYSKTFLKAREKVREKIRVERLEQDDKKTASMRVVASDAGNNDVDSLRR
jgi:hypothetical protein